MAMAHHLFLELVELLHPVFRRERHSVHALEGVVRHLLINFPQQTNARVYTLSKAGHPQTAPSLPEYQYKIGNHANPCMFERGAESGWDEKKKVVLLYSANILVRAFTLSPCHRAYTTMPTLHSMLRSFFSNIVLSPSLRPHPPARQK